MAQTKTIVLSLVGIVLFGLIVCGGGGAYWYFTHNGGAAAPADVGPLAGQALWMPADSAVLGGFDVKGFLASEAYKKIAASKDVKDNIDKGLSEGEAKTGIRFDRDVDRVVLAVSNVAAQTPDGAVIALGRFDRAKLTQALEASAKAEGASVTTKTVEGVAVDAVADPGKPPAEFAVVDASTFVAGTPGAVEAFLANRAKALRPLEGNAALLGIVKGLDAASGYWLVIDEPVIARGQKEAGGNAPPVPLPKNLTLAGKFDGGMDLTGEMADEAAAKGAEQMLSQGLEMVRGMAAQNAQQVPGAKAVLDGVKIAAQGKSIRISLPSAGGGSAALGGVLASLALPSLLQAGAGAGATAAPPSGEMPQAAAPNAAPAEPTPQVEAEAAPPAASAPVATLRPRAPAPVRATPPPRATSPARPAPPTTEAPAPPPTAPAQPVHVGGTIPEPRKTRNVTPNYPAAAKAGKVQGMVILEATVSAQGKVTDVKVLRSIPLLDPAAVEAVRQWEYEPTLVGGVPVPVVMTVTVNFKMR